MSLDIALGIARSGLLAVQRGLAQSAQNIANAETPGYTRKTLPQQATTAGGSPAGLRTGEAQREVDAALVARLDTSRAALAAAEARERLLTSIEQAHGTAEGGSLADALSDLRSGFIALRGAPADPGRQRKLLEDARTLAQRLNGLSEAIGAARQQAQDGIVQEVAAANAALREIASLTLRLKSGGDGNTASLEDQRDAAIARLAESLEVRAVRQPGGDLLLLARGGLVLPLDPDRDVLETQGATVTAGSFFGSGGTLPGVTLNGTDITAQLGGGRLGEYITLRDHSLPRFQAEADIAAANLAHRLDAAGLRLFTDAGGGLPDPSLPYAGSAQIGFAGRITLNPKVETDPTLLRDGTSSPPPAEPNPSGFTDLLDRVLTHSFGDRDPAGKAWPPIRTSGLGPNGKLASPFTAPATLADYAARLAAAQTGDRAAATEAKQQAEGLRDMLQARFAQVSGVDVDAEMAAMVALQNAYAANARVLGTLQSMWDSLLAAVR